MKYQKKGNTLPEMVENAMLDFRKVEVNGYESTMREFIEANDMERKDYFPLFNLAIGDEITLDWMTMPVVKRTL